MALTQGIQHFYADRRPPYPLAEGDSRSLEDLVAFLCSLQENRGRLTLYVTGADTDKEARDETLLVLGELLGRKGHRVLVVDADFLAPGLSDRVETGKEIGFLDLLFYGSSPASAFHEQGAISILAAGSFPVTNRVPFSSDEFNRVNRMLLARNDFVLYGGPDKGEEEHVNPLADSLDVVLYVHTMGKGRFEESVRPFTELGVREVLALEYGRPPPQGGPRGEPAEGSKPASGWGRRLPILIPGAVALILVGFLLWWGATTLNLSRHVSQRGPDGAGVDLVDDQAPGPGAPGGERPSAGEGGEGAGPAQTASGEETGAGSEEKASAAREEGGSAPGSTEVPPGEAAPRAGVRSPPAANEETHTALEETRAKPTPPPEETRAKAPRKSPIAILRGIPGMGDWAVWISSFRTEARAEREVASLGRKGFQARAFPMEIPGKGLWYRVYVGNYSSRSIANEARALLLEERSIDFAQVHRKPFDH